MQEAFFAGLLPDVLGFAGAVIIRRILGIAHVVDYESITDADARLKTFLLSTLALALHSTCLHSFLVSLSLFLLHDLHRVTGRYFILAGPVCGDLHLPQYGAFDHKALLCRAAVERRSLLFARELLVEPSAFSSMDAVVEAAAACDPSYLSELNKL